MGNEDIIWDVKRESINKLIESGKRADGRQFDEFRKIEVVNGYVPRAEGSTLVRMGKTQVLAGVKVEMMTPWPDSPEEGILMTGAELVPMASPVYYAGPPTEEAIEFARVVDRGIRESKSIDFSKLCVEPGEKVWSVMVDLHVLDYDGNLFDAGALAAINAVWNAKIPKYEDGQIIREELTDYLPVKDKPVSSTFVSINSKNILDPVLDEEKVMNARLTLTLNDKDCLCASQKSGTGFYKKQDFDEMFETAVKKSRENRKLVARE